MFNSWRICVWIILFFSWASVSLAQDCHFTLSGTVYDEESKKPLSLANVLIPKYYAGDDSDNKGQFQISRLCEGAHQVDVSHVGYEPRQLILHIQEDLEVEIFLKFSSELLDAASIEGGSRSDNVSSRVSADVIDENASQNLAQLAAKMPGVSLVSTGGKVSKPMIQGMFGNRVTLVNNGVTHNGQQWGADHSPELDPLSAGQIEVLTGVRVVEHMGNSIGGVIKLTPSSIRGEKGLHGSGQYFYESNGSGHGLNFKISNNDSILAYGISATAKKSGDLKSADYFLRNTGGQEASVSGQFEYAISNSLSAEVYCSSFNAKYGVLRGSHISNLTDLEGAFNQDIPFYTENNSSYNIEAPFQRVNHHMANASLHWDANENLSFELRYAIQIDQRKEFDVRRGGRTTKPALSLEQGTHFFEGKATSNFESGWQLNAGAQYSQINNVNIPETGILPLIPNYLSQEIGGFVMAIKEYESTTLEIGGRADFGERRVAIISFDLPRTIEYYSDDLFDFNGAVELRHQFSDSWAVGIMTGIASRVPDVNELYSNGLHQGVSGIEEGDPAMKRERSHRSGLRINGDIGSLFSINGNLYFQNFQDYILLVPQDETRLTIRGAFPVFKYEQTDAKIFGYDVRLGIHPNDHLYFSCEYSFTQGTDVSADQPLIYMPANRLTGEVNFKLAGWRGLSSIELGVNNMYSFEQERYLDGQDFIAPPAAYNLLGMNAGATTSLGKLKAKFFIRIDNLLNVSYRDYLNRLRYFADDLGVNAISGVKITF